VGAEPYEGGEEGERRSVSSSESVFCTVSRVYADSFGSKLKEFMVVQRRG
jgi:hypothetical protein